MENEFSRAVDAVPGMVWTAFPDGRAECINQRWCEYTGLSAKEAAGTGWLTAIHPDDRSALIHAWLTIVTSGKSGEAYARMRRADGEYRRCHFRASPLSDATGAIIKWWGDSTDVEERGRLEDALRAQEQRFRLIVDGLPAVVYFMKPNGDFDHANRYTLEYAGVTTEELKAWATNDLIHADDRPEVIDRYYASIKSGEPYDLVSRYRIGGAYHWCHVRGFPLRNDDRRIVLWYFLMADIDDRKRTEEKLRKSEAFLAEGQRLSLTGSFAWCPQTDEITWSEQLYRIFDFEPGSRVTSERVTSRIHPDDVALAGATIGQATSDISDWDIEFRLLLPGGSIKFVHIVAHGTRNQQGALDYFGAVQDVTRRRQAEEALGKARTELAHVARVTTLGSLTASIAHEVNQPLSGIITNANTCLRMLAAEPPNIEGARETARRTLRDGTRASDVIARLRTLFSKKVPVMDVLDLNDATREVIALSLSELQRGQVALRTELSDGLPPVTGDRIQLQQVILNLLRNASDAMSEIHDRPRQLTIRTVREEGDRVRVTVQDAGVGLNPQEMDRLFQAFYTTKKAGMGVGLSVSRSIIENHHGRLWATRNEGHGATFSFSIPRLAGPTP